MCNPGCRLCECTEAEAEIILQLKNELREKELKLTDIRLEALSSAHHLDQIREAMNRMQVRLHRPVWVCFFMCDKVKRTSTLQLPISHWCLLVTNGELNFKLRLLLSGFSFAICHREEV